MINQAIHTLDLMQLIGREMKTIRGSVDNLVDYGNEVEDTAVQIFNLKMVQQDCFLRQLQMQRIPL